MKGPFPWSQRFNERFCPNLSIRLAHKATALIVLLILLVSAAASYAIYALGIRAVQESTKEKLMMLAATAASSIDSEKFESIRSRRDEAGETYRQLQKQLQKIQNASLGKLRYVYTIAKRDGRYIFIVDATPNHQPDHSSVGDPFHIQDFPYALKAFSQPTVEEKACYDRDFKVDSQSGYAPIRGRSGKTVGIIGVDMDVTTLKIEERRMRNASQIALIIAGLMAIFLGGLFSNYLTKPIILLTKSTRRISKGDLDTVVAMNRQDEFGELAVAFNKMTQDLKRSHESLRRSNSELEEKVAKRTTELSQINKEMKDILDHIGQAVFTIDRNLCFNAQHSKFAHLLFGDDPFAGRNLLDLLFGSNESTERNDLSSWLQIVFNQTIMQWDDLEALQPFKTMAVIKKAPDGREQTKFIEISFRPIEAQASIPFQAEVEKIMVLIQDITDKKQLEAKMVQQEQAYKDNIDQIVGIIKADQDLFRDFINECREQLIEVEPKLIALRNHPNDLDLINDLFRIMHTIKGNAQVFKLERIAAVAHGVEEIFSSIRKGDKIMDDRLLDDCFSMMDRFTTLFNETLAIYQRIINEKSLDMGRTRAERRISEDSKVVKVKVEDIHHLGELVKTMELFLTKGPQEDLTLDEDKFGSVQSLLKETEQQLRALKKVQVGQIFPRFPRMVRDISTELGKTVRLITTGEEYMIDKYIFEHIGDPMIHLIRNALDHGVECPEQRLAAGKPAEATIRLDVTIQKDELVIIVQDDGRGLDIESIKSIAMDKRLLSPEQAQNLSDKEIADLIFIPGFSTSPEITSISGRGVGMDVVKTYIKEKLNGTIILENREGLGLTVILKIPLNQD